MPPSQLPPSQPPSSRPPPSQPPPSRPLPHFLRLPRLPAAGSPRQSQAEVDRSNQYTPMGEGEYHRSSSHEPESRQPRVTRRAAGAAEDVIPSLQVAGKATKDGVPKKRRGPKRDSKPAETRRQEMNRQAQRTHRERKEFYVKSLENETQRFRGMYYTEVEAHMETKEQLQMADDKCKDYEREARIAKKRLQKAMDEKNALKHQNERYAQLLDINKVPFEHLVPPIKPLTPSRGRANQPLSPHLSDNGDVHPVFRRPDNPMGTPTRADNNSTGSNSQRNGSANVLPGGFVPSQRPIDLDNLSLSEFIADMSASEAATPTDHATTTSPAQQATITSPAQQATITSPNQQANMTFPSQHGYGAGVFVTNLEAPAGMTATVGPSRPTSERLTRPLNIPADTTFTSFSAHPPTYANNNAFAATQDIEMNDMTRAHPTNMLNQSSFSTSQPHVNDFAYPAPAPGMNSGYSDALSGQVNMNAMAYTIPNQLSQPAQPAVNDPPAPFVGQPIGIDGRIQGTVVDHIQKHKKIEEQLMIDFVLAIEGTCRDHLARANEMATDANFGYALHGHALMLSNTPFNQEANAAAGHPNVPEIPASETPADFLLRLLHMAKNLPLKGELPPIVALERIREDDRFPLMTMRDFESLVDDLKSRTKCYGFGAALEEYEVYDALDAVFINNGLAQTFAHVARQATYLNRQRPRRPRNK